MKAELINLPDAAARLGMGPSTLRTRVTKGQIGHVRYLGRIMFTEADLDAFLEACHVAPTSPPPGVPRMAPQAVPDVKVG